MAFTYSGNLNGQASGTSQAISVEAKTPSAGTHTEAIRAVSDGDRNAIVAMSSSSGGYPTFYGENTTTSAGASGYAVYGRNYTDFASAVYGDNLSSGFGVAGSSSGSSGTGVFGIVSAANANAAIKGVASQGQAYAGVFMGRVFVNLDIYATSANAGIKSFLIDHPLDPENRTLRHSSVESSERKNLYDGVATADANGELTVQMPLYFDALNDDIRYQLTAVGGPAPNLHVKEELRNGRLVIAGAAKGQKVCWLVTGNRKDPLALANPLVVEEDKPADERGFYLNPEAHGQHKEKGIAAERWGRTSAPPFTPLRVPDPTPDP